MKSRILVLALTTALAACVRVPEVKEQELLRDAAGMVLSPGASAPTIDPRWWQLLGDPQLDALIERALAGNPSLHVAQARLRAAQAQVDVAGARDRPRVDLDASIDGERFSERGPYPPPLAGGTFAAGRLAADFSWDLDLSGRQRALIEAAGNSAQAQAYDLDAARLTLSAAVASAYVQLDRALRERAISQDALKLRQSVYDLTQRRVDAGLDTRAELLQAEVGLPQARLETEQAQLAARIAQHQLAALIGDNAESGEAIAAPTLHAELGFALPQHIRADLLGRRPDIAAARARVEAALSSRDAARREFYPDVNLTAFAGFYAIGLPQVLDSGNRVAGITPAFHLPLFDAGRLRANYRVRGAELDQAIAAYNQTLTEALRETADAIASVDSLGRQRSEQAQALNAAEEAYRLTAERYRAGLSTYISVLIAETTVLAQRRQQLNLDTARHAALIALLRALGGGFDAATPTPLVSDAGTQTP